MIAGGEEFVVLIEVRQFRVYAEVLDVVRLKAEEAVYRLKAPENAGKSLTL